QVGIGFSCRRRKQQFDGGGGVALTQQYRSQALARRKIRSVDRHVAAKMSLGLLELPLRCVERAQKVKSSGIGVERSAVPRQKIGCCYEIPAVHENDGLQIGADKQLRRRGANELDVLLRLVQLIQLDQRSCPPRARQHSARIDIERLG